ncbi:hypothetical protein LXA47_28635 [Massilia sp. P8910]|uniref:hypothetical protein n=1 Tax=Massilia antarctica TaxID=2765360 RepID=UPI001E2A2B59|nr:hypothetical protein [Massilia antarctica]MCE3607541.1 hypothetical protein [Massilia antarctica]
MKIMNLQSELRFALSDFLVSGNAAMLQFIIEKNPEIVVSYKGEYPDVHRITDVSLGDKCYRVCRQISAGEKLIFAPINEVMVEPGVPLWLSGEKLNVWAELEEKILLTSQPNGKISDKFEQWGIASTDMLIAWSKE